ncbi:MAG TPA: hypothetical protein VFF53_09835 [Geobacteraceae bacterium]|nr:hypothetical protein [Geobacteraceae bacterium]
MKISRMALYIFIALIAVVVAYYILAKETSPELADNYHSPAQ